MEAQLEEGRTKAQSAKSAAAAAEDALMDTLAAKPAKEEGLESQIIDLRASLGDQSTLPHHFNCRHIDPVLTTIVQTGTYVCCIGCRNLTEECDTLALIEVFSANLLESYVPRPEIWMSACTISAAKSA